MPFRKDQFVDKRGIDYSRSVFSKTNLTFISILAIACIFLLVCLATNDLKYLAFIIIIPLGVLVFSKPIIGLDVFIFWLIVVGVVQPVGVLVFGANLLVIDLLALLALPAFINAIFAERDTNKRSKIQPFTLIYLFILLTIILGVLHANDLEWVYRDLRLLIYLVLLYLWSSVVLKDRKHLQHITIIILIAAAIAGAKALIIEHLGISSLFFNLDWQTYSLEIGQLGITRVLLGGMSYFAFSVPIAAALFSANSKRYKVLAIMVLPFILLGLIVSFSRTPWVGAFLGFLVVFFLTIFYSFKKTSFRNILASIVLLSFILIIIVGFLSLSVGRQTFGEAARYRLQSLFENRLSEDPNVSSRTEESRALFSSLGLNIFVGKGIGATYQFYVSPETPLESGWSHNGWAWLILKGGILGLMLVLTAIYLATRDIIKFGLSNEDSVLRAISVGYLGAIVTFISMSLAMNTLALLEGAVFLGIYFGIAKNMRQYSEESKYSEQSSLCSP